MLNKKITAIFITVAFILCGGIALAAESTTLKIIPAKLGIGTFFAGEDVALSGSLPSDGDIIIEVIGPRENAKFNIKGRVGPFWMNRAKVVLQNVPFLYVLLLPGEKKWEQLPPSLELGVQHLKQDIGIIPESLDREKIFEQFIQLKRFEHLYLQKENTIHYSRVSQGGKIFTATFHFPSSTTPGEYRFATTLLQADRVVKRSVHPFQVEEVGVIKTIHELAYHQELIYGILCVVIALFVGAVIGLVFVRAAAH